MSSIVYELADTVSLLLSKQDEFTRLGIFRDIIDRCSDEPSKKNILKRIDDEMIKHVVDYLRSEIFPVLLKINNKFLKCKDVDRCIRNTAEDYIRSSMYLTQPITELYSIDKRSMLLHIGRDVVNIFFRTCLGRDYIYDKIRDWLTYKRELAGLEQLPERLLEDINQQLIHMIDEMYDDIDLSENPGKQLEEMFWIDIHDLVFHFKDKKQKIVVATSDYTKNKIIQFIREEVESDIENVELSPGVSKDNYLDRFINMCEDEIDRFVKIYLKDVGVRNDSYVKKWVEDNIDIFTAENTISVRHLDRFIDLSDNETDILL